jgi:hypothetical protein
MTAIQLELNLWELSHYAKQHPTVSTRNGLNNVNKLGCAQLRMSFLVVRNQQLEISMVTMNNNQEYKSGHIRALTESFDSKLADAGNPLVWQLGRHLCRPRADWSHLGNRGDLTSSRPAEAVPLKTAKSARRAVPGLPGCPD